MDELTQLITALIDLNTKLLNENAQLKTELAKLRPASFDTILKTRERKKRETSWRNIDKEIAKNKESEKRDRCDMLAYLLRQGAKSPESKSEIKRGRPATPVEFDWANLPKLVEIIKIKSNYKTDKEAIAEILQVIPRRTMSNRDSANRNLQVRLSKIRAKQKS